MINLNLKLKKIMWTIIKFKHKQISILKDEIIKKLGNDVKFFIPKLRIEIIKKNKVYDKENYLLGNYMFCFHKKFSEKKITESLKYCRGLNYFLDDYINSQVEINSFINKCEINEDKNGFLKQSFFNYLIGEKYEFLSGPFSQMICKILNENKKNFEVLIGKYKATVSKEKSLFRPI